MKPTPRDWWPHWTLIGKAWVIRPLKFVSYEECGLTVAVLVTPEVAAAWVDSITLGLGWEGAPGP